MNKKYPALLIGLVVTLSSSILQAAKQVSRRASVDTCKNRDLSLKDCYLSLGTNKIHVWNDKIFLSDKLRDTHSLPVASDKSQTVEWASVSLRDVRGRVFLEVMLWGRTEEKNEIETLTWSVYEITSGKIVEKITRPIQKRKKMKNGKFNYDKSAGYGFKAAGAKVLWFVGREQGSF